MPGAIETEASENFEVRSMSSAHDEPEHSR